ncbi:hypothetical protein SASPL_102519 [Salvia splendens]|uniref:RCK N-terminal domain-containing protein n=1 Tax=Salvia splendens TaxID=180675 RepID=A0A8X8YWV1_SALSN|nr:hypothetical protein SASPL_102519 [Salvia splendens]
MEVACSLSSASVIYGGEIASGRAVECLNFSTGLGHNRGYHYKLFGDSGLVLGANSPKRLKKKKSFHCANSNVPSEGNYLLRRFSFNKSSINNNIDFKILKHVGLSYCQKNDSVAYINGNSGDVESTESRNEDCSLDASERSGEAKGEIGSPSVDELRDLLQKALKDLEIARHNSIVYEEKAQRISEAAIASKDEATNAWIDVNNALQDIQEVINEEAIAQEGVQKAALALSFAEARFQVLLDSIKIDTGNNSSPNVKEVDSGYEGGAGEFNQEEALLAAQEDIQECKDHLANCEAELERVQNRKAEVQKEVDRLNEVAELAQINFSKAEEKVANIMLLAEQAVAHELLAAQCVDDAEIALQRAEKNLALSNINIADSMVEGTISKEASQVISADGAVEGDLNLPLDAAEVLETSPDGQLEEQTFLDDTDSDKENGKISFFKDTETEPEKLKTILSKVQETQKETTRDGSPLNAPKAFVKKSSRFFSASFFSFSADEEEFSPASVFRGLVESARKQLPKLVLGSILVGAGIAYYNHRGEKVAQFFQQPGIIATSIDEVSTTTRPLINEEEASLFDMLWLLLASVIFVPIFQKIPGGSPVLGYLAAGILIGPYGLSIIRNVHETKAIAEFGVVFLLFNIGLELSVERLSSMKKYVFGLGSTQVLVTAVVVGLLARYASGLPGPAAIVIGNGLALSSTAVVLQVLQERGESTSRHGRATFSVLLFQDLAVVVLLILIPLISPTSSKGGVGFQAIAEALGIAAVKAVVAISVIIAGGRLLAAKAGRMFYMLQAILSFVPTLLRPIYKQIAENQNAEIFSANTLFVILGTSLLTARAGLSMALGAFLAGLLLAETEFSLQVESDIAPYRGLLLGLFFMTVGMSIDPKLLFSNFPVITGILALLIVGKTILVAIIGRLFGISIVSAVRVGLLLAPGGEFAFVAFGEAVNQGIMSPQLSSLLFLVVGISMALTPWLAAGGQFIASRFEQHDVRSLLPVESETDDLQDHIILCGFGRVGEIIAQLLSERLIPFVALDVNGDRVAYGRALDLPVYFGDAGSQEVLHKIGAERACAAAITLDSPGANYRTVWALSKYFPNVKTFVRAHDVNHGVNLEKAGATAVVPETLEPSLQLAAAVLAQAKLPASEIAATIDEFRSHHLSELTELCEASGSSLGYGFSKTMSKPKSQPSDSSDDNQIPEGSIPI